MSMTAHAPPTIMLDTAYEKPNGILINEATTVEPVSEREPTPHAKMTGPPVSERPRRRDSVAESRTQKALVVTANKTYQIIEDFPAPQDLAPHEVMIRNHATGLNHIDFKSVDYNYCLPDFPWITGREMAGVVECVGSEVVRFRKGDRVWSSTYYKDRRAGCFQDLVVVPEHTVLSIPANLDYHAAAGLGVPALTAAMTLWKWLGVSMHKSSEPSTEPSTPSREEAILIWGGSSVTGQYAIQLAARSGLEVIAICSSKTASLVSSLGATHVVTYNDKTEFHIMGEILHLARGRLTKAIDVVGPRTAKVVLQIIAACGQQEIDFAPLGFMAKNETIPANAKLHNVEMKRFILDSDSRQYGEKLNELIQDGSVRMPETRVMGGGVSAVEQGLELLKRGDLAGQKLIVSFIDP